MADDFKQTLWKAADKLRAQMDAAEYKHIVLGLIFLNPQIESSFFLVVHRLHLGGLLTLPLATRWLGLLAQEVENLLFFFFVVSHANAGLSVGRV